MNEDKTSKMAVGFNHNIKHNGKIYHVQTEDSGAQNPHIITHLFVGGNILATKKTSYADIVKAENLQQIVRELMEEQHKAMLRNLVNGVYDNVEDGQVPEMKPAVQRTRPRAPAPPTGNTAPERKPPPAQQPPAPAAEKFPPPPRTQVAIPRHEAPTQRAMPAARVSGTQIHKPPPPETVPKRVPQARPVTIKPKEPAPGRPAAGREAPPAAQRPPTPKPAADLPPEVLAARRLSERPVPKNTAGPTIFGEDLISEKSLDEVILGYLSGEGEEGG